MTGYALPIKRLIAELGRLPGIGEKTATRLATFILRASEENARRLAECIVEVKLKIRFCSVCFNLAEGHLCEIGHSLSLRKWSAAYSSARGAPMP